LTNIPARLYNGGGEFLFDMTNIFEESAQEYDEWYAQNEFAYLSELAAIKAFMPTEGHGLEIGVGTGRFAAALGIKVGVEPGWSGQDYPSIEARRSFSQTSRKSEG
jgi:hypothetical protein